MKYQIKFSANDIAIDGTPLAEARQREYDGKVAVLTASGRPVVEVALRKVIDDSIQPKCNGEKEVLQSLLREAMKTAKNVVDIICIGNISKAISASTDSVIIDSGEFTTYVIRPFDKIDKPAWWMNMSDLFKQLASPQEYKEGV